MVSESGTRGSREPAPGAGMSVRTVDAGIWEEAVRVGDAGASANDTPARDAEGSEGGPDGDIDVTTGVMWVYRAAELSGCAALFSSPAEQITLAASGFAAGATVSFTGQSASLGDATPSAPVLADVTADADGLIEVTWSVPAVPAATVDPAPRGYAVVASGANPAGGVHTARIVSPVVAYPGVAPCAVDDTASTPLGQPVQVAVLANDVTPSGGSLDPSSVEVRPVVGGEFSVDAVTGIVTFSPDAGFWGAVDATYAVYDGWGIGVEADLTVTVDAGCTVTGAAGVTTIEGTEGDDVICVPDRDDHRAFHVIDAKGGDDIVLGGAGVEWIYGGEGADTIYGNGGDDRIVAGAGIDTVHGGPGMDTVYSADMADTTIDDDYEIVLSPAEAVAQSGPVATDDWVWVDTSGTARIDVLDNDHDPNEDLDIATLVVTAAPASGSARVVTVPERGVAVEYTAAASGGQDSLVYEICDTLGACAEARVSVMVGLSGCTIVGTSRAETLRGTPGDDVICGLGGGDILSGGGGNDILVGGDGADALFGGAGDDLIAGGAGADVLYGDGGIDELWGGAGDDELYGGSGGDSIWGGAGIDFAEGGGGDDLIWGGPDADTLDGQADGDSIWGGAGDDVLRGGAGIDILWGGIGADTLTGGGGSDKLHGGAGNDVLGGGIGDDHLWGGPGDDRLDGGRHRDELHGGLGMDMLWGGAGGDRLWGGPGEDTLDGGNGDDHLDGGTDADTCANGITTAGCEILPAAP